MTAPVQTTPFTILTGFLGAGKTTLLNHVLSAEHNHQLAVIVNEFGSVNIDSKLVARRLVDSMVEMSNGCVCCTVQQDLLDGLNTLLEQRRLGKISFDHIVLETTGMAKVGPIVQTVASTDLKPQIHLGSVVTVVDALHVPAQLDQFEEAQEQVGIADLILLNKTDLVPPDHLDALSARLASMNAIAQVIPTQHGQIAVADLLDHANTSGLTGDIISKACARQDHDHEHHSHSDAVHSFAIQTSHPLDHARVQDWLSYLIMRHTENLLRYKGILNIAGRSGRVVLQGVHAQLAVTADRDWQADEPPKTELVFIGKNLPEQQIRQEFEACIAAQQH